jgi:integrase
MANKRDGIWQMKRTLPGVGLVRRSLGTRSGERALTLESMVEKLADRGRGDLIRAWMNDDVSLATLAEAYDTGKLHLLSRRLQAKECNLAEAIRQALRAQAADVQDSTLQRYATGLAHFEAFAGSKANVRESLTTDRVTQFKAHRLDTGAKRETVNNDLGAVSVLATFALRQDWIEERPLIKRFPPKVRIRYLESKQVSLYLAALRPAFQTQMLLLVTTGMRLGESEAMRVCDIRFGEDGCRVLLPDSKTAAGLRPVFVPPQTALALKIHVSEHGLTGTGRPFSIRRRSVQAEHTRTCKLVGIEGYTIHDHRHTAAVHLARAGMPLGLLKNQLGHKTIQMTMRYAQFHPDYSDVGKYFAQVEESFGLAPEAVRTIGHSVRSAEVEAER